MRLRELAEGGDIPAIEYGQAKYLAGLHVMLC
jgi:hypothetical protein